MKKDQSRSNRPSPDNTERDAAAARGLQGAIGGALSRVFERAGIDVRVVPAGTPEPSPAQQSPAQQSPAQQSPAQQSDENAAAAPAAAPPAPAVLAVHDALVAVAALAIGRQLLTTAQAAERASEPAPQCDRLSDLLSSDPADAETPAPHPLAPVAGRAVVAGTAAGPARPAGGTSEPRPSARPAPAPRRNVTIRY
ncbi:MAG: hypothetical protein U1A78_35645 [Polyangia bacterium]